MNILITGGRGQLGLSLQKIAADYPCHRFVFTDMPEVDITDPQSVSVLVEENRIDAVINCAAYTAVDKAESEPEAARKVNVDGPQTLAAAAVKYGLKLVHISTDYVFPGTGSTPLREDDPTGPDGVYGETKLLGEQAIAGAGCDALVVRTSWLYSEFGSNFVKTMLRLAETRSAINVVDDQKGSPTYAPDLAGAIMTLLEKGFAGYGVYHYCDAGEISWYDLAMETFRRAGIEVKVNPITTAEYPTAARRPAYSVLDTAKVRAAGAVTPFWKDSLKECIEILKTKI
jgi:dTDP-4-dehydrorhamnose reductase